MRFQKKHLNKYLLLLIIGSCYIFYYLGHCLQTMRQEEQIKMVDKFLKVFHFNLNKDVLVFVHIQKTGGSDFDRNIVKHLLRNKHNKWIKSCNFIHNSTNNTTIKPILKKIKFKKFACKRDIAIAKQDINWYFSRQTFGWICGLHPDYTDLSKCVKTFYKGLDDSNFYYFTILRDPVKRYLSEWRHVARGATWRSKKNKNCLNNYEKCFKHLNWENVTLNDFMSCKYNLANNRQTRLLAQYDSKFKLCSNPHLNPKSMNSTQYDEELLKRAKETLDSMSFFALNEYQQMSGFLFEKTFNGLFKFEFNLEQTGSTIAEEFLKRIDLVILNKIKKLNHLDLKLYEYAVDLFFKRVQFYKKHKIS